MPIEIYAEILKSSCYQKVISKQLNFYNSQHFYHYCMILPITKNELAKYLLTNPRTIVFFKKIGSSIICYHYQYSDHYDCGISEYSIDIKDNTITTNKIGYPIFNFDMMKENNYNFDLLTIYNIVKSRPFSYFNYKKYIENEMIKYCEFTNDLDLYSVFNTCQINCYFYVNIQLLSKSFKGTLIPGIIFRLQKKVIIWNKRILLYYLAQIIFKN